ncbi:DUF2786 domain-containing protein [Azospira sp. APE16]|uniref:DUF2786 domain-containing protein n=1 Tax=Azospira sp. APE16 TaxID=3394231 RepID=UPI003A4DB87B
MSERHKILDKIKKCLALSASSNEHEAEAALRQAKKLMETHGITDQDVQAAEAEEHRARAGAKTTPPSWEESLASKIADAFGCRLVFSAYLWNCQSKWSFIGCGAAPEVASYAFSVLHRQAKRARDEHIKTRLKRCKRAIKTRRADLFNDGWVHAVAGKIESFAGNEQQTAAIDAYMAKHYPSLGNLKSRDRNDGRTLRDHEHGDFFAGHRSGRDAQLNRGVGGADQHSQLEDLRGRQ